ncbi:MAG: helix-turn-helix domain-containing protein [Oscillospiraceae bacterium]|nr:helix-turn-helix domain-containing protein [Oscillospiraceae bacterium]
MPNTKLLNNSGVLFESHVLKAPTLPFRYHQHVVRRQSVFNIHENIEFLYVLQGEGRVVCDGVPTGVTAGDIAAVNSYSAHQVVTDGELGVFCLIIDSSFCLYHSIDPTRLCFQPVVRDKEAQQLMQQVMTACADPECQFGHAVIQCRILELLLHVCQGYASLRDRPVTVGDSAVSYVRAATQYIKDNLSSPLTAQSVAASAGVSKYHFLRQFKRLTGVTLSHYINDLRCERARRLLEQGDCKVKEVACLCGFSNMSYFSRTFRQYTGLLPSQVGPDK